MFAGRWLLWSPVGFGLFYAPMAFAVSAGPGWLLAGTWQITILAGILLAPLLYDAKREATNTNDPLESPVRASRLRCSAMGRLTANRHASVVSPPRARP